jgi:hypothetical protein
VDLSKIEAIKDWATPQDLKQLQSFLGLCATTEDLREINQQ